MENTAAVYRNKKPELIIGIVARLGVDIPCLLKQIRSEAVKYNYDTKHIKVTNLLKYCDHGETLVDSPIQQRYLSRIKACNSIRAKVNNNSVFSLLAMSQIRMQRDSSTTDKFSGTVYVIDQLKRKEEIKALRDVYGESFVALSCHSPVSKRLKNLEDKITADNQNNSDLSIEETAGALIAQDEKEENLDHGQDLRGAFPLADYILDCSDEKTIKLETDRFFRFLFGDPSVSPTFEEYGNNLAAQAAYRSIDLSRQVGAAIFDKHNKVVSLGCNEVPKFGGGTYWEGGKLDGRDHSKGYDYNTKEKRQLVVDIVKTLIETDNVNADLKKLNESELSETLLNSDTGLLRNSKILNILEYGRALHAEMNAITDAARSNSSTQGSILFVTTFPCHNCAKHIVGSGVAKVYYLEPYPKSEVSKLYPDSITIDPDKNEKNMVVFAQFCGVTKRRFHYFSKAKLKDETGKVLDWFENEASCHIKSYPADYDRPESIAIRKLDEDENMKSHIFQNEKTG